MQFNPCRAAAFNAFCDVLAETKGSPHTTEISFRDAWLDRLRKDKTLYASGWYDPPPYGLSVLFAPDKEPDRISFESLRQEKFWPKDNKADWNGFLFAYSSCVDRKTGLLGDFDVTLYFGSDPQLKKHYHNCFSATGILLHSLTPDDSSGKIFKRSEEIFADAGLKNCVISMTDIMPLDLGHTYPILPREYLTAFPQDMTSEHKNLLRTARNFINNTSDWSLEDGLQFTIEPQLRSVSDPLLPQISLHYLVRVKDGQVQICRDVDALIKPYL